MTDGDASQHPADRKFPDGSIRKVVFHNFLTYEQAELRAGENLNLIIGSNGSGKSTVICGICLAVGGSPKHLGRSERLTDYIRHGAESGFVEVHIEDAKKGTQRMKIVLNRSNHFEYHINGSKRNQKTVREMAASYNIQVDNPCTFLAQDKVKSFSEQNPMELLRNTEKAGNPELFDKHEELIGRKTDFGKLKATAKQTADALKDLVGEMDRLKPRVDNFKQKKERDSKINALDQKHSILTFTAEQEKLYEKSREADKAEKKVMTLKKEMDLAGSSVEKHKAQIKKIQESHKKVKHEFIEAKTFVHMNAKTDFYNKEIQLARDQLKKARRMQDDHKSEVDHLEKEVGVWKDKIQRAQAAYAEDKRACGNLEEAYARSGNEFDALEEDAAKVESDKRQLSQENYQLSILKRQSNQVFDEKVRILKGLNCHEVADAFLWIQENGKEFEHPIYVPFFHISIPRDKAHLLEGLVAFRDSLMFICGSRRDEATLATHWKRVNTTVMDRSQIDTARLSTSISSRLQQLGFRCFVSEIFTAPDPVLQYLCNVQPLHMTPMGDNRVNDHYEEVIRHLADHKMNVFLAGNQRCQITVSKYSHERLTSNSVLRPARLYLAHLRPVGGGNKYEEETLKLQNKDRELRRRQKEIDERRTVCEEKRMNIRKKDTKLRGMKENINRLIIAFDNNQTKLNVARQSKPSIVEAEKRFADAKQRASTKTLALVKRLSHTMEKMANSWARKLLLEEVIQKLDKAIDEVEEKVGKKKEKYLELFDEKARLTEARENQKRRVNNARKEMYALCNVRLVDKDRMTPEEQISWQRVQERFERYSLIDISLDDLEAQMEEERAKKTLQALDGSQQDVDRYEKLAQELDSLEEDVKKQTDTVTNFSTIFAKDIAEWKEPVKKLVEAISKNYTKFFDGIECVGAVELSEPEDPLDIAGYGIQIMVSFRATDRLRRLDHQVQSGGERSVSTMLYILALQELCPVPFRCVDEINQGMDPTNERKVFDIMVKTLTGDGKLAKTQYFLLTPKLLRGLTYNEKVTIQTVHNSRALCSTAHQWSPYAFLEKMKSLKT